MGHLRAENTYFPTSPRPAPNLYPTPSFLESHLHHLHLHGCTGQKVKIERGVWRVEGLWENVIFVCVLISGTLFTAYNHCTDHGKNQFIITNAKFQSTSSETPPTDAKIFSMVAEEMIIIVVWRECASNGPQLGNQLSGTYQWLLIPDNTLQYHVIPCLAIQYQEISIARRSFIRNLVHVTGIKSSALQYT